MQLRSAAHTARSAFLPLLLLASSAAALPATVSSPTPSDLYQLSLTSDRLYSYRGLEFITSFHDDGRSLSTAVDVAHRAPDLFRITYRAPANLAGRVIFHDDRQQWTFLPNRNMLVHSYLSLLTSKKRVSAKYLLLKQNFHLELDSQPRRVGDRKAFVLTIMPIRGRGPTRKLWIDPDTGIVLRTEQYHVDGSLAEVAYFSEIQVNPAFPKDEFLESSVLKQQTRQIEGRDLQESVVAKPNVNRIFGPATVVPRLLGRYHLQSASIIQQQHTILHLRYSDGLASLSLFESARSNRLATRVPGSRTVTISQSLHGQFLQLYSYNLLSWDSASLNFTLVGEPRLEFLAKLAGTIPNR